MKKKILILSILLSLALIFGSCAQPVQETPIAPEPSEEGTIEGEGEVTVEEPTKAPEFLEVTWETGGPYGQRYPISKAHRLSCGIEEVNIDPQNPDVAYAKEYGKIWKTEDGGQSWEILFEYNPWIEAPEFDPGFSPIYSFSPTYSGCTYNELITKLPYPSALRTRVPCLETEILFTQDANNPNNLIVVIYPTDWLLKSSGDAVFDVGKVPDDEVDPEAKAFWGLFRYKFFLSFDGGKSLVQINPPPPYDIKEPFPAASEGEWLEEHRVHAKIGYPGPVNLASIGNQLKIYYPSEFEIWQAAVNLPQ